MAECHPDCSAPHGSQRCNVLAYVEQMLCPTLRPADIVICDNLGSHKVSGVRGAIEARGASLLYLQPYSLTSTQLNSRSASSNVCSDLPQSALSMRSGRLLAGCFSSSPRRVRKLSPPLRLLTFRPITV